MPNNEEHCKDSLRRYGKSFAELHAWMDEPCTILGATHRKYRHDPNTTPQEAKSLFGESADHACLDHIRLDALESRKKGINKGSLLKEPSAVKTRTVAEYTFSRKNFPVWTPTDKKVTWEQITRRCPKCNAVSGSQEVNCPFCGAKLN
jgi:hypothetical protein